MTSKNIAVGTLIGIALLGVIVFALRAGRGLPPDNGTPTPTPTSTPGTPTPNEGVAFRRTGNLSKDAPGQKPGVWYLVYEQAGQPALSTELEFDASSRCVTPQGASGSCAGQSFSQGQRADVEGRLKDGVVRVQTLTLFTAPTPTPTEDAMIRVTTPQPNAVVRSPLTVEGQARGNWFFEASFPVKVLDANGKVLGTGVAQAQGEWMTTEFVSFRANVSFTAPTTKTGTLVLEKDNPSGLPQNADERRIPIQFEEQKTRVKLYYYDPTKDRDASGNVRCSSQGLVAVDRDIPRSSTPLLDTVRELLRGNLTKEERARGVTTEFPLAGLELKSAVLSNGVATLTFVDPQNRTGGGSCRAAVLWAQIEATAKQFPGVREVRFSPSELFQP